MYRLIGSACIFLAAACGGKEEDSANASEICGPDTVSVDGVCLPEEEADSGSAEHSDDANLPGSGTGEEDSTPQISVDDACGTDEHGYDTPSQAATVALERTNCYRNLMGLSPTTLEPRLDDAAQAHADYMLLHETLSHTETAGMESYTGDHVWDRMETAGYPLQGGNSWSEVISRGYSPSGAIDTWMETVYHRESFTLETWRGCGFGQAGEYSSMAQVMGYPDDVRQAVIFPVDGQIEVPTSFDSDSESPDPAPDHGVVGYPVTVTVTHNEVIRDDNNTYGLTLDDATLLGPDGAQVDVLILTPENDEGLASMVALVPTSPLEPGATYEAEITVTWASETESVRAVFTTSED